ncbi:hypothetical protein G7Z17_g12352 [Cylindrodendrum hubeiense]|uniref:Uncharacterized protein n=1 Tax=Cylindrodendrum hubeiense TaxID=595255 RepID=A0A9P5L5K3_9HYPO|nr:hypothetical protein G7Z17_g12352 [Cylindrodendrum hubeiense]
MKFTYTTLVLAALARRCISASVDMWSSPITARDVPRHELIDPEELKARLGKTPAEYNPDQRHAGMVYFCYDENWGPPCYAYYPELNYACSELNPEISGHVGSVFVEPGAICRMARPMIDAPRSTSSHGQRRRTDGLISYIEKFLA